jgi:hypothetical protein
VQVGRTLALLIVFAAGAPACGRAPSLGEPGANLLAGLQPARSEGAHNPELVTDGKSTPEGEPWGTSAGAVLDGDRAHVDYDLGRASPIRAVYLQGDNNDGYVVSVSDDGASFRELWASPAVAGAGMRERMADGLAGAGRWIRLSARGGDGMYAVVELQVYSERPAVFPPRPERVTGASAAARVRTNLLYLVLAFALLLAATHAGSGKLRLALLACAPIAAGVVVWLALAEAWPPAGRDVAAARAAAAAVALLALIRACDCWRRFPAKRVVVVGACAAAAALALACFYNLGRPQFTDHARGRPEFVHLPDMRIYQPFVKYFDEVRYDGVYLAGVLAYAEDQHGGSLVPLASVQVRSMRDQRLTHVSELAADISTVRARFSDKRWAAFKRDMVFFRQTMGPEYLTTLTDHGANAPPLWVLVARPLLGFTRASEASLVAAGLVDGVLFLLMAFVIARTFGVLPMCVAMTVFGANDLYMFGTNWAGATLRHDWLVLLAFAACALKVQRWTLAGALLGVATMLRVLPAAALVGVAIPAVARVVERSLRDRRPPRLADLLREHKQAVRVLIAAAATMLLAFVVTGVIYGFGSWVDWWRKIVLLNRDSSVNEVNLRALVAGADAAQAWLLRSRRAIVIAAAVACVATVVMAARRRPLHEAMLLAMPLMLVFFNPVSYHVHFIFLLVLIETSRGLIGAASPLLAFCVASYWTTLDPDADRHFQLTTAMLFAALGWYYANVIRRQPVQT